MTARFVKALVAFAPFIRSVSIAGSLASGGFRATDDVDLNLIVDDGHRHLAYVAVNTLGLVHALAHRAKPVDALTRRPLAPRLMTANLILERSQCLPLQRQDEDMAFELLMAEPVYGEDVVRELIDANPGLLEHFPQLANKPALLLIDPPAQRLPALLFPRFLDGAARTLGEGAWRYMQWTRRHHPDALARVAFVRSTMRPYTLFDRGGHHLIAALAITILGVTSVLLFAFGVNLLYLTWRATRLPVGPKHSIVDENEPLVCVQVPVYNERYVAERVLDAVCAIDWPSSRMEIQVLDDSDDETTAIVAGSAARWRLKGMQVAHVRRGNRTGFKAGALAYGLTLTNAPLVAIFDADFVPPRDFLRRTVGAFEDPSVGFAQARWGHLDEGYSWFTRLQALAIDFHFLVEQAVRSADGYFTNFTGTAGVWRRSAIEDSGGWSADTLTEDLDLSYRAQLRGWRAAYLEDLVVPEELPVSIDAYRRQQSRWATGSFQSAFKLLLPVLRSRNRAAVKLQATVHLLAYGIGPLMLLQLMCYPALLITLGRHSLPWPLADASALVVVVAVSPWLGFIVAQTRNGRRWWSGLPSLLCQVVGAGMSLTAMLAMFRATRPGGQFIRTPKHRIEERGQEWRHQAYVRVGDPRALAEALFGLGALAIVPLAATMHQWLLAVYASMFALGFLSLASFSAVDALEVLTLRNLGRRALTRLRAAGPKLALLGLCGALLLFAAQMPEPFEDGYGHWLIAANLASTGHLHDPLFGMEDTWLPGYHVLAAAVLHVFGLWQLGALKALGALLGLFTLSCVYALAPNTRQARLAVALLALNPVFLFTSGSAVVEPLLTALLTAGALAAVRGRMKVAALLAALACITATKAWIWIAAVAGFAALELLRRRAPRSRRMPAIAWAVPAIAVLVFLQLGFAPASHSVARGSLEVASATARGSLPGGALTRDRRAGSNLRTRGPAPVRFRRAWAVERRAPLFVCSRACEPAVPPCSGARLPCGGLRAGRRRRLHREPPLPLPSAAVARAAGGGRPGPARRGRPGDRCRRRRDDRGRRSCRSSRASPRTTPA